MPLGNQLPFYNNFHISSLDDKVVFKGGGHAKDLTPHICITIYLDVIKVNINKAFQ
jgi:hypothetical protein